MQVDVFILNVECNAHARKENNKLADMYFKLNYAEFKELEKAMKEFNETSHGEGTEWYHKAVRIPVGEHLTIEFHGPGVKARMVEDD